MIVLIVFWITCIVLCCVNGAVVGVDIQDCRRVWG